MAPSRRNRAAGFTLIELILVMAVLATVGIMSIPHLTGFVKGRSLNDEARRFLAAARHARGEAMSNGIAAELWIEPDARVYGVRPLAPDEYESCEAVEFALSNGLSFEIEEESISDDGQAVIRFWPDGCLDEASIERVRIRRGDTEALDIVLDESRLGYVIRKVEDAQANRTR